jgi:hypothetical protein
MKATTKTLEPRLRELEDALRERELVVQMLTQRLEQAADQLDRWQRNGTDRRGSGTSGFPPELIESQQTLLEQMTRFLSQWDEIQAGPLLCRIETQICELKDLVASGTISPVVSTDGDHAASKVYRPAATVDSRSEPVSSGWEAIKAAMMAGEAVSNETVPQNSKPDVAPATSVEVSEARHGHQASAVLEASPPIPDPPAYVDTNQASIDELREAVHLRDEFISMLIRRMVAADQSTRIPDWEQLNQAPDELRKELEELRRQLQQKLRIAEVDLSLQRARLAREDAKLQVKAEHVARQMRQMGLPPDEPTASPGNSARPAAEAQQGGRRWLQFLQRPGTPEPS